MTIKERLREAGAAKRIEPTEQWVGWRNRLHEYFDYFFKNVEEKFVTLVTDYYHSGSVTETFEIAYGFDNAPYQFLNQAHTYWMSRFNKMCLDRDMIVSFYWSNGEPFVSPDRLDDRLLVRISIVF